MSDLYDKDFYTWAMTQADAAKRRAANARFGAANETGLDIGVFPAENPLTLAQAMDENFWPEA